MKKPNMAFLRTGARARASEHVRIAHYRHETFRISFSGALADTEGILLLSIRNFQDTWPE